MSFFKEFDDLLAIFKDPGILERRKKVCIMRMNMSIADMILGPLEQAAKEGMDWKEAVTAVRDVLKKTGEEMIRDLEAIDKPMPVDGEGGK